MTGAVLCMAFYNVWSRPFIQRSSALGFLAVGMGAGAAALLLAGLLTGRLAALSGFGAKEWIAGVYLGVAGGALAFILWVLALERATPTRVANTMTVNPVAAALLATVLVSEPITLNLIVGADRGVRRHLDRDDRAGSRRREAADSTPAWERALAAGMRRRPEPRAIRLSLDFRLTEANHLWLQIPTRTLGGRPCSELSIASLAGAFLGVSVPVAAQAQSQAPELPDGAGKELVEAVCTACHQTNQITRSSGYTADGWQELIGTMIDLSGSPEQQGEITAVPRDAFPAERPAGRPS